MTLIHLWGDVNYYFYCRYIQRQGLLHDAECELLATAKFLVLVIFFCKTTPKETKACSVQQLVQVATMVLNDSNRITSIISDETTHLSQYLDCHDSSPPIVTLQLKQ